MTDSLVFGGIELLGGGVTQPAGWQARLAPGWALGEAEPQTSVVESLLLDGERVTGDRSGDRSISLPVVIIAPTLSGATARTAISAGVAALQMLANNRTSTLTWTPSGGLPAIFDTFRGKGSATWNLRYVNANTAAVQIDVTALPYSRSPDVSSVSVASAVQLDAVDSGSMTGGWTSSAGGAFTSNTWSISGSNAHVEGSAAAYINASWSGTLSGTQNFTVTGTRTGLTARDVTNAGAISVRYFWSRPTMSAAIVTPYSATLTLTDNVGHTASITTTPDNPPTNTSPSLASFKSLSFARPSSWPAGFDPTHVTGWSLQLVMTVQKTGVFSSGGFQAGIDDIEILPAASSGVTTTNGGTYRFPAVGGTARTPINVQATRSGGIGALVLHKAPPEARADYSPLVPYGSASVGVGAAANMPSYNGSIAGARYDGSHVIILAGAVLASGTRTITVTFTEIFGDPVVGGTDTTSISRTCTSADVLNGLLTIGVLTLPKRRVVSDNTATSMTVTIADPGSAGATSVQDVLVLDMRGPTVIVGQANGRDTVWIDEPDVLTGVGAVLIGSTLGGTANGRASAVSNWDSTTIDPGPLSFDPGDNTLLAYCPQGAVTLTASYAKRYLAEAV